MNYGKTLARYERTKVETSGKLDLVILCYEKAIQYLTEARDLMAENEFEKKAGKLNKALNIIYELQASLDFEKGGEIARNLSSIYSYIPPLLLEGDVKKDLSAYENAIRILSELKEAWEAISSGERPIAQEGNPPGHAVFSVQQFAA